MPRSRQSGCHRRRRGIGALILVRNDGLCKIRGGDFMSVTYQAVYEGGVFRPLEPVTLPEKQVVTVTLDEPVKFVEHFPMPYPEEEILEDIELLHVPLKIIATVDVDVQYV